jgi:hypothetical protein
MAGKMGTGLLYLFTFGVFTIGWIIDSLIALGSFVTSQTTQRPSTSSTKRAPSVKAGDGLEFMEQGKEPEKDELGRVIVRLGVGSQIQIPLHFIDGYDEEVVRKYIQGKKLGELFDDGEKTLRFRLVPAIEDYWGGTCYRFETPSGHPTLEARDYFPETFALIQKVIREASSTLRGHHSKLADSEFVFDVPIRFSFEWVEEYDDEGEETGKTQMVFDDPMLRLKDPLEVEIRSDNKETGL